MNNNKAAGYQFVNVKNTPDINGTELIDWLSQKALELLQVDEDPIKEGEYKALIDVIEKIKNMQDAYYRPIGEC